VRVCLFRHSRAPEKANTQVGGGPNHR